MHYEFNLVSDRAHQLADCSGRIRLPEQEILDNPLKRAVGRPEPRACRPETAVELGNAAVQLAISVNAPLLAVAVQDIRKQPELAPLAPLARVG
jgi:hypothetical protein